MPLRQQRFGQRFVFLETVRERMAAELAVAAFVRCPDGRLAGAREVSAHDEVGGERAALTYDHAVRVGHADDVVGGEVVIGRVRRRNDRHLVRELERFLQLTTSCLPFLNRVEAEKNRTKIKAMTSCRAVIDL